MCSPCADTALPVPGLPIRESTDQRLFNTSPWLIAVVHALLRLLVPRHPPCALDILTVIARPDPAGEAACAAPPRSPSDDETQFLNWPAVQFSRSGRGANRGPLGRRRLWRPVRGDRGRSLKTQQCSCASHSSGYASRRATRVGPDMPARGMREGAARPGSVDIPRTARL